MPSQDRRGVAAGGNWIVDRIKTIDRLPGRGMLANIRSESCGTGGAPANVLVDLARLRAPFPLFGHGVIGDDPDGRLVLDQCRHFGIDIRGILTTRDAPTSYTDVMAEADTGDRSFFHHRGANALFGPEHVQVPALTCRIFHLGYLLLLDRMDQPDPSCGTVAAGFLRALQAQGIKTSLDVVSEESDRFRTLVPPSLHYVDYLILNEIEAGRIAGYTVRRADGSLDESALAQTATVIGTLGTMALTAIHMPEGVYLRERSGRCYARGSRQLPPGFIRGALGAGDAFCAGMLFGLHEGWPFAQAAELGIACSTACLADPRATDGVVASAECLALAARFPERQAPVSVGGTRA